MLMSLVRAQVAEPLTNTTMINLANILNDTNFVSDPFPHFRIYDVLPQEIHSELYQTYDSQSDTLEQPHGGWNKNIMSHTKLWDELLTEFWESCDVVMQHAAKYLNTDPDKSYITTGVSLAKHTLCNDPGKLIRDWHIDGSSKYVNIIYYLGSGSETHGNIELCDMDKGTDEYLSYPYTANSMIVWANIPPFNHRFRQSNQFRKTVYTNFASIDWNDHV